MIFIVKLLFNMRLSIGVKKMILILTISDYTNVYRKQFVNINYQFEISKGGKELMAVPSVPKL